MCRITDRPTSTTQAALVGLRGVRDAARAYRARARRTRGRGELSVTLDLLPHVVGVFADCIARRPGALERVRCDRELPGRQECGLNHPAHVAAWMALEEAAAAVLLLESPEAEAISYTLDVFRSILESDLHFCRAAVRHHLRDRVDDADDLIDLGALADVCRATPAA